MTKREFTEKFRHEWGGMLLDAATSGARGAELSVVIRNLLRKVDSQLGVLYDALTPDPLLLPRINGTHKNGEPSCH